MTETSFSQIIVVSAPGRRRDSLLVLLSSMIGAKEVYAANTFEEGKRLLEKQSNSLVIVDHHILQNIDKGCINEIRSSNPKTRMILMLPYPKQKDPSIEVKVDAVLYDGFSSAALIQLIGQMKY